MKALLKIEVVYHAICSFEASKELTDKQASEIFAIKQRMEKGVVK